MRLENTCVAPAQNSDTRLPGRKDAMRKHPPGAAASQHIKYRVDNLASLITLVVVHRVSTPGISGARVRSMWALLRSLG